MVISALSAQYRCHPPPLPNRMTVKTPPLKAGFFFIGEEHNRRVILFYAYCLLLPPVVAGLDPATHVFTAVY